MIKKNIKNVVEGGGGLLNIEYSNGVLDTIRPHYPLNRARELLLEFYNQKTSKGLLVKNSFIHNGVDYFPSCISFLYWNYFYGYTRYENILSQIKRGELEIQNIEKNEYGNFRFIFQKLFIQPANFNPVKTLLKGILRNIFWIIIKLRNKFLVRVSGNTILFLRESFVDFRSKEVVTELKNHYKVIEASWPTKRDFLFKFFDSNLFFCGPGKPKKIFSNKISGESDSVLCRGALEYANEIVNQRIASESYIAECIRNKNFLCMVGMDDCNYAYPVIYACRKKGISTVGIQHAFYCDHHESYVMRGIEDHLWYENLLVYGEFWKEMFLKHNKLFDPNKVLVCRNKTNYNYKINSERLINKKNPPLSILLIYEFLADTVTIGNYIKELMNLGCKIYFKARLDESVFNQISAYQLDDELTGKWTIVKKINENLMSEIDAVVGTYSTMLFDLYPYGKRILRFDTAFELNDDSLEGYSLKCNLTQLEKLRNLIAPEPIELVLQKSSRLNGDTPVSETIHKIINRALI